MTNPRAAAVSAAYRASQQLDQRPVAVLAALHDALHHALSSAMFAHEARALDQMCRHNARATQILTGLTAALAQTSGDVAELLRFYQAIQRALNRILTDTLATKALQNYLVHLNSMRQALRAATIQAS